MEPATKASSIIRKFGVAVVGGLLIIVGVLLLVLPGPGLLVILAGVTVLATEFEWAKRRLQPLKDRIKRKKSDQPKVD